MRPDTSIELERLDTLARKAEQSRQKSRTLYPERWPDTLARKAGHFSWKGRHFGPKGRKLCQKGRTLSLERRQDTLIEYSYISSLRLKILHKNERSEPGIAL